MESCEKILEAIEFIRIKHEGQTRNGTGAPYAAHPIAVSYILASHKSSERITELIIASLLHDTLEDTDTTYDEISGVFGGFVASLVKELTNDVVAIKSLGKLEYHKCKFMELSSYGLTIKLCDRLHNVSDQPSVKMLHNTISLIGYVMERRTLNVPQLTLCDKILSICSKKVAPADSAIDQAMSASPSL
ncbi:HD domain-containing protein [Devosia sp.]|uniref:HD domain-containing protein n=1 Tax=Devosia sp. TaxID=1871048 RepID=UPI002735E7CF|nr:HD domain-containing protein [Devosia sp.]MDP2782261.1 HD domain-containing protein [Devosia sp.]